MVTYSVACAEETKAAKTAEPIDYEGCDPDLLGVLSYVLTGKFWLKI